MVSLVGWYQIPNSVTVTKGCLDKTVRVRIAGHAGRMRLPGLQWDDDGSPRIVAPQMPDELRRHISHWSAQSPTTHGRGFWGNVSEWHPQKRTIVGAHMRAVLLEFQVHRNAISYGATTSGVGRPEGAIVTDLLAGIDEWFDTFRSWLEVKYDQDIDPTDHVQEVTTLGRGLGLLTMADQQISSPAWATGHAITVHTSESVTLPSLRRAAMNAGQRLVPGEAHLLLRDARAALRRSQLRRAVIDAGSALELCLADFNQTIVHANLRRNPTLGMYVRDAVIAQRGQLPASLMSTVVHVRNAAIHQNVTPTHAQASVAIDEAARVIHRVQPSGI